MGKKKGYNVAEIDLQQEDDAKMEKTESFTVKDYDAIANDVVKEQPGKQLNTDLNKEEINSDIPSDVLQPDTQAIGNDVVNDQSSKQLNTDHISSDSLQTETKDVAIANEVVNDQPCEQFSADSIQDEIDDDDSSSDSHQTDKQVVISETNAVESVSYKKLDDAEDDNQLKKDVNSQSTADIDAAKSNLDTGATTKQEAAKESSNLKAAEKFTSIDLGEIKHAPKNSPATHWFKRNQFFVIGIVFIVGLIVVISIAASSRKEPTTRSPVNTTTCDCETNQIERKSAFPPGMYPASHDSDNTENHSTKIGNRITPTTVEIRNEDPDSEKGDPNYSGSGETSPLFRKSIQ